MPCAIVEGVQDELTGIEPSSQREEIPMMHQARVTLSILLLAMVLKAQTSRLHDASLEDLVHAADGKLACYAVHLDTGAEISLNAGTLSFDTTGARILVAIAALERLHALGQNDLDLPRQEDCCLGRESIVTQSSGFVSVKALIEKCLVANDDGAFDCLRAFATSEFATLNERWLAPHRIRSIPVGAAEREILIASDEAISAAPIESIVRWWRDRDLSGLQRLGLQDPRRDPEFPRRLEGARARLRQSGTNLGSPRVAASLLRALVQNELTTPERSALILDALRRRSSLAVADETPPILPALGIESEFFGERTSLALIESGKGRVIVAASARGYGTQQISSRLLATAGRAATRRLLPGSRLTDVENLGTAGGVRRTILADAELLERIEDAVRKAPEAPIELPYERTTFKEGDQVTVAIVLKSESTTPVAVLLTDQDGAKEQARDLVRPGPLHVFKLPCRFRGPGTYRVQVALGGNLILNAPLQIVPK